MRDRLLQTDEAMNSCCWRLDFGTSWWVNSWFANGFVYPRWWRISTVEFKNLKKTSNFHKLPIDKNDFAAVQSCTISSDGIPSFGSCDRIASPWQPFQIFPTLNLRSYESDLRNLEVLLVNILNFDMFFFFMVNGTWSHRVGQVEELRYYLDLPQLGGLRRSRQVLRKLLKMSEPMQAEAAGQIWG